jgi:hypothetical protein
MVGAATIDLTAFVRSRILKLFVRFVRFVVKHPVSGRHAIGPIRVSDTQVTAKSGFSIGCVS